MIVRPGARSASARAVFSAFAVAPLLVAATVACSDSDATGPSAEIQEFCQSLFSSPSFACCRAADRDERQFAVRNRYQNIDDCTKQLGLAEAASEGRRAFDAQAASSCLAHLAGRQCGVTPSSTVRAEEEKAGCGRILRGTQKEAQLCIVHEDCKAGLICPPVRDTTLSYCSPPAPLNQGCVGSLPPNSIDHPACEEGLVCTLVGQNPACPLPPCLIFQCVPLSEEGEACTGLDCKAGLSCLPDAAHSPICQKATGPSPAGGKCRAAEQCAEGLYCNTATSTCAAKKAAGGTCVSPTNVLQECKGFCKGDGATGVCVAFCGSD